MELLDFYAKILPDKIFTEERKKRQQPTWVGQAYASLHGTDLSEVDLESDRIMQSSTATPTCNESGAYSSIMGCHIPVQRQTKQPIVERFWGDDVSLRYQPKREVPNMFNPNEGIVQNNLGVDTDYIKKRAFTSNRANDGVEYGKRVSRGLGRESDDTSQRGIHPLLRVLPKNVSNLRGWLNAKKTYKPLQKIGQMGAKGSIIGEVEKRTPETFTDRQDLSTRVRSASQTAPKQEGKHRTEFTQRAMRSVPITGQANPSGMYPAEKLDFLMKESFKNEYRDPDPLFVTGTHKKQKKTNVHLSPTQRSSTTNSSVTNPALKSSMGNKAVNYFDIPKDTTRQSIPTAPVLNVSTITKGTPQYSVPGMTPNITGRDISLSRENHIRGVATSVSQGMVSFDPQQAPRETLKGSLPTNPVLPQQGSMPSVGPAIREEMMTIRDTLRSTHHSRESAPVQRGVTLPRASNFEYDVPRDTLRQTTTVNQQKGIVSGIVSGKIYTANDGQITKQDNARSSTGQSSRVTGGVSSVSRGQRIQDDALPREQGSRPSLSINKNPTSNIHGGVQESYTISKDFVPRDCLRETTQINKNPASNVHGFIQESYTVSRDFNPRESVKETTQYSKNPTNFYQASGGGHVIREIEQASDMPSRETLPSGIPHSGISAPSKADVIISNDLKAKETQRETTEQMTHTTGAWRLESQGQGYIATKAFAKETQRESTGKHNEVSGIRHVTVTGGTVVDKNGIQLNEARNEHFDKIQKRFRTKIGNAAFPNKTTVVGDDVYLKPDSLRIDERGLAPHHSVYEIPSFTNRASTVVNERDISRGWSRIAQDNINFKVGDNM